MNNEHTMIPDAVRVEYLRGYRAGLVDARYNLTVTPFDRVSKMIFDVDDEIKEIEARTK